MPVYLDWSFWAVVIAAIAIVLSQLPPVALWFRRADVGIETYSRIGITHKVGNPNATIHLTLHNKGGRTVRVNHCVLEFERDGNSVFTLPAQNFLPASDSSGTLLFTPFSMKPGEEWAHGTNFLNFFGREDERLYRSLEAAVQIDIAQKRAVAPDVLAEADDSNVQPLLTFFEERFDWHPGAYRVTVKLVTDRGEFTKRLQFIVFESQSEVLRSLTDDYKYGAGIYWDRPGLQTIVSIELQEDSGQ